MEERGVGHIGSLKRLLDWDVAGEQEELQNQKVLGALPQATPEQNVTSRSMMPLDRKT